MLGSTAGMVPCTSSGIPGLLEHLTQSRGSCRGAHAGALNSASMACTRSSVPGTPGGGCCRSACAGLGDALQDQERVPTSWQGLMSLSKTSAWSRARGKPSTCRASEQLGLVTHQRST